MPVDRILVAVRRDVDVVGEHNIDCVQTETLEGELERAHDTVIGIVEAFAARRRFEEGVGPRALLRRADVEEPADLGGNEKGVARLFAQKSVEPRLGQPEAIKRRRIEVTATDFPHRVQQQAGFFFRHRSIKVAERRASEPQFCETQLGSETRHKLPCSRASRLGTGRHRAAPPRAVELRLLFVGGRANVNSRPSRSQTASRRRRRRNSAEMQRKPRPSGNVGNTSAPFKTSQAGRASLCVRRAYSGRDFFWTSNRLRR